ncbi:hypothetical protein [Candidatus Formimonas warabiya]|uniref:Uncharacterized protein n=1 Tax=Formimonas warabiya TaxID=1761012 RepID=A0A3G1KUS2_FORW1|nr:hypothetical protein [Candidatus Formimonas warabiya]ATW26174.1 hypothetical protein DCMF_16600 [Candidatus Formimonas warabiya]
MTPSDVMEDDEVFEISEITFVVERKLWKRICPVKIDYQVKLHERGFVITSGSIQVPGEGTCNI